jgi:hypothetical protein
LLLVNCIDFLEVSVGQKKRKIDLSFIMTQTQTDIIT